MQTLREVTHARLPDTNPQKYRTCCDRLYEEALQPLFDQFLPTVPGGAYTLSVDVNGYLPCHHRKCAQPLTGNYDTDLLQSRDRRIYDTVEVLNPDTRVD